MNFWLKVQRGSCLALMLDIAEELLLLSWSISSPIFHLSRETPSEASDGELQRLCEERCSRQLFQRNPTQLKPISTANKHDVFSRNLFLHWFFTQACIHASYYIDTYTLTDTSVTSLFKGITSRNRKMHLYWIVIMELLYRDYRKYQKHPVQCISCSFIL